MGNSVTSASIRTCVALFFTLCLAFVIAYARNLGATILRELAWVQYEWPLACSIWILKTGIAFPKPRGDRQRLGLYRICPAPAPLRPRACRLRLLILSCSQTHSQSSISPPSLNFFIPTSFPSLP